MKIGIYDMDSKIPNLALMKISAYHKKKGDIVEFYSPLFHESYDKIYASKIFTFSSNGYIRKNMIIGGSGYDLEKKLPHEIEHIYPDYNLYSCDYAMGFMTRGCIRKCPFCIVSKKEGNIQFNAHLNEFCKEQKEIMLLDNNILSYEKHNELLEELIDSKKKIDFNQGLDIRLINPENIQLLKEINMWKHLRFALDNPALISLIEDKIELLKELDISFSRIMFYVLIGYNTSFEEDLKRVLFLQNYGFSIFVMPFNKFDQYQKNFTRWVNRFFYKYIDFKNYIKNKEIKL